MDSIDEVSARVAACALLLRAIRALFGKGLSSVTEAAAAGVVDRLG